jgi:hypothetical protein
VTTNQSIIFSLSTSYVIINLIYILLCFSLEVNVSGLNIENYKDEIYKLALIGPVIKVSCMLLAGNGYREVDLDSLFL